MSLTGINKKHFLENSEDYKRIREKIAKRVNQFMDKISRAGKAIMLV